MFASIVAVGALLLAADAFGQVSQITENDDPSCAILRPAASVDGSLLAFESNCDLVGDNADGNREIFLFDLTGAVRQQITDSAGCAITSPSIAADGSGVAFDSDCNLDGMNADGSVEVYHWDGANSSQMTAGLFCDSLSPSLSGDGALIAFDSNCDLLGTNADELTEVFRVSAIGVVEQLTDDDGTSSCESIQPIILADGDVIYSSSCDPLGTNVDLSLEIFEIETGGVVQQTDSVDCDSFDPTAGVDPLLIAFASDCDPNGRNTDESDELFVFYADCACGGPVSRQDGSPTATDALFTLNAAVGLTACRLCDCDVDNGGSITALDALTILNSAVGIDVPLTCP